MKLECRRRNHKQVGVKPDLFDCRTGGERAGDGASRVVCECVYCSLRAKCTLFTGCIIVKKSSLGCVDIGRPSISILFACKLPAASVGRHSLECSFAEHHTAYDVVTSYTISKNFGDRHGNNCCTRGRRGAEKQEMLGTHAPRSRTFQTFYLEFNGSFTLNE